MEGIEGDCAKSAEGVLHEAENAKWEKQQIENQYGLFSIHGAAGQGQHHSSVNQSGDEGRDDRSSDGKDGRPAL